MLLADVLVQAADSPTSIWSIVQTGGIAGVLFLGLYFVLSGRIPTKQQLNQLMTQLTEMTADRDFWRGLALKGTSLAEGHIKVTDEEVAMRLQVMESNMSDRLKGLEAMLKAKNPETGTGDGA